MKGLQDKKVWELKKSHLYSPLAFTGCSGRGSCRVRAQAMASSGKWLTQSSAVAEVDVDEVADSTGAPHAVPSTLTYPEV
jgi:hypothetical protein